MDAKTPLLLTVNEAARQLSLARSTVYELLLTRQLVSVKIGRARRVPLESIRDFIERLKEAERGA